MIDPTGFAQARVVLGGARRVREPGVRFADTPGRRKAAIEDGANLHLGETAATVVSLGRARHESSRPLGPYVLIHHGDYQGRKVGPVTRGLLPECRVGALETAPALTSQDEAATLAAGALERA